MKRIKEKLLASQIWKSIFRHVYPRDRVDRAVITISNFFLHLHPPWVTLKDLKIRHTWCMGGIALLLFLIETITGVLLMFYYRPVAEYAYRDMKDLEFAVTLGLFLRNMHRWGAHAMVLAVMFHMLRVFLTGAYKPPREFNWVMGVSLLVITLLLSFTGYLLPWDQLSLWAITVGTYMASATPLLGHEGPFAELVGARVDNDIRFLLLGGTTVGPNALLRFYVLHCVGLPLVAGIMMAVHFWRVRKDRRIIMGPL